jgi:hypothetical protein
MLAQSEEVSLVGDARGHQTGADKGSDCEKGRMIGIRLLEIVPLLLVLQMNAVPFALSVMFTVSVAVGSNDLYHARALQCRSWRTSSSCWCDWKDELG